jgi:DNA-directed RNA polymerase II subunit RPB2
MSISLIRSAEIDDNIPKNVIDTYYKIPNVMVKHHINSFDNFIDNQIYEILEEYNSSQKNVIHAEYDKDSERYKLEYHIKFGKIYISKPVIQESQTVVRQMYPNDARLKNLTYSSTLKVDIYHKLVEYQQGSDVPKDTEFTPLLQHPIGKIPIMLQSKYCVLSDVTNKTKQEMGEDMYDYGGYFIVNGNEKVIIMQEKKADNIAFVFKFGKGVNKYSHKCEISSVAENNLFQTKSTEVKIMAKEGTIGRTIKVKIQQMRQELPLFVVFRALGIISDKEICELILYNISGEEASTYMEYLRPSIEEAAPIQNMQTALEYASKYIMLSANQKNFHQNNKFKLWYTQDIIREEFLPHVGKNLRKKAFFLGYMVNKMLNTVIINNDDIYDDRDSFLNKRVETTGGLMASLFRSNFKKMMRDVENQAKLELSKRRFDDLASGLAKKIKKSTIDSGLKYGLSTGNWGLKNQSNKKGIAQVLNRLSYLGFLSHLRRIQAPIDKTLKNTAPRKLHNTQWGKICPAESPEGQSIGIVKNMSLTTYITTPSSSEPVRAYLQELEVKLIDDIKPSDIYRNCKILVNGDWIGIHFEPHILIKSLYEYRRIGKINIFTSISWDVKENEMNIFTDGGRLSRPLFIVEDNQLVIKDDAIAKLKSNDLTWEDLLVSKDGSSCMEYIDVHEENTSMISQCINHLKINKRTDDKFYKYTHCEIDPTLIFGIVASVIPLIERNQAPRVLFYCAQAKQGIGIYATNFENRLDTMGHVLYYPQCPLVSTNNSNYINFNELPSGQNVIVAIASHTGYNQEDSIIINQSSLDRGLFVSSYFRTYFAKEQKNSSTLEEEKFCKPQKYNPNGTIRTNLMKQGASYDKLEENGFVKEGTRVNDGDVIIGKCIPLKTTSDDDAKYRDASTSVKPNESGIVDKVYIDKDGEGFKFAKVRVRTERIPQIGDKYACYTPDHDVLTTDGWIPINEITTDHKVASLVDGKRLKYVNPIETMEYDCDEDVYEVNTNSVSLKVTKNHRMWMGNRDGKKYGIKTAEECYGKRWKFMKNCEEWIPDFTNGYPKELKVDREGKHVTHFLIYNDDGTVEHEFEINAWLTFFGIWMAEGCVTGGGVRIAAQKDRVKNELKRIEPILNWSWSICHDKKEKNDWASWRLHIKLITEYMKILSVGAVNKQLPKWVWYLTKEQSKILIEGMECGDGHIMKNGTPRYDTSSIKLADDYQRLCLHAGFSANKYLKYAAGHESYCAPRDEIFKSTADAWRLTRITKQNNPILNKNISAKTGEGRNDEYTHYTGKVYCCQVLDDGIIYVRRGGNPVWCGNSRHGQKGTCGITYTQEDMPFNKDGITPDIIINPHAIPSRMTIGQLIECIMGKVGAISGCGVDGTPFTKIDADDIADILQNQCNMERYGNEVLYNGRTGEQIYSDIFMGPTYYHRLKHMVEDKMHSRSTGPYQLLTRQPAEGRARAGGLRIGEMERDAMLSHGTVQFLKERMFDTSDKYFVYICKKSGMIAAVNPSKDIYKSLYSDNATDFDKVQIPYATKLFIQELMTMGITTRLFTENSQ